MTMISAGYFDGLGRLLEGIQETFVANAAPSADHEMFVLSLELSTAWRLSEQRAFDIGNGRMRETGRVV